MLLTEYPLVELSINDIDFKIGFNFKTIQNLYYVLKENFIIKKFNIKAMDPLEFLNEVDKDFKDEYLSLLIHASNNGAIGFIDIEENLKTLDKRTIKDIKYIINAMLIQSLIYISKDEKEKADNENSNSKTKKEENNQMFEEWFNYYYCMAIDKLNMTVNEFLLCTPAQLKERINIKNIDFRNNLISLYNIPGKSSEDKKEEVEEVNDLWELFHKI